MLFPTFTFAVFFAIVLPVGWLLHQRPTEWKLFMLGASYVFYGWWDWRFLGLIIASSVVNQGLALAVHRSPTVKIVFPQIAGDPRRTFANLDAVTAVPVAGGA